ncbi:HAD domain-containing protein [Mycobacterium sp. SA01]|uniref:HAD domain-containing protein n=1 Tax=Mycobacterium sp. SA01 TaxID=3238820 RepID=UPI00351BEA35
MPGRPLLFLDVDGTLLSSDGSAEFDVSLIDWTEWQSHRNPRLAGMDRTLGRRLLALGCELVWATAWMRDANEVIAPLLGLPPLPVAELPEAPLADPVDTLHWKTAALVTAAAGRNFAWVDDEISDIDRAWVATHHAGSALLHRVDPRSGLTGADLAQIGDWLAGCSRRSAE